MTTHDLVLNIAVNMGRLGRWVSEGKTSRIKTFFSDSDYYVDQLDTTKMSPKFRKTFDRFTVDYRQLKNDSNYNDEWAERAFTWANILTHRAKLA